MNLRGLVLHYLRTLQERGCARLPLDEEARAVLRGWMQGAGKSPRAARSPASPPLDIASAAISPQSPAPPPAPAPPVRLSLQEEEALSSAEGGTPEAPPEIPFFRPGGKTPEEIWENFDRLLPHWKPLRELGTLRPAVVPGEGNRHASIFFVGDAPNYYDEKEGAPFRGEAGGKLDGMLRAMGLTRQDVYITHLVKFRPALPRQTFNNRPPGEKEILYSSSILELEIQLVRPKVIVALGVIAARSLLRKGELPLASYQQMRDSFHGIPVVVTHHPSYLLRTSDLAERRRLWEEMLRVMELAQLPINAKQRGYFLPRPV